MFNEKQLLNDVIKHAEKTCSEIKDKIPYLAQNGVYDDMSSRPSWWTNGFYPGILWQLYDCTSDKKYSEYARKIQEKLDPVLDGYYELDHDAGFIWFLASVRDYILTGDKKAKLRGMKAASSLASRFNPSMNYIRAWNGDWAKGHAIIDSLMNLPLLYWCSEESDDNRFYNMAVCQAERALNDFVRADGSVRHIVVYDDVNRKIDGYRYGQGYSEDSSWGRGTAWALYGLALSYKYTRDERFLRGSEKVASFVRANMNSYFVPYADYLAPDEPRRKFDSSAGAVTACGFLLLNRLTGKAEYRDYAVRLIEGLVGHCAAPFEGQPLLLHGNVAYHAENESETDISIIYGDYFFFEAVRMLNGYKEFF